MSDLTLQQEQRTPTPTQTDQLSCHSAVSNISSTILANADTHTPAATYNHFVQFYETDEFLVDSVVNFVRSGDTIIIVATEKHAEAIRIKLTNNNSSDIEQKSNISLIDSVVFLNLEQTLESFMVDGLPNKDRFFSALQPKLEPACSQGKNIRVFGEMVAHLWSSGNHLAAMQLEELWDELSQCCTFSLLCAYPLHHFGGSMYTESFLKICDHHTKVFPTEQYPQHSSVDARLRAISLLQQQAESLALELEKTKLLELQKDEFLAIASHELKTPLTSMKMYSEVLKHKFKQKNDTESYEYLSKIDTQITRLSQLVTDLLDVTKIKTGQLEFNEDFFDPTLLIKQIVEYMQFTTDKLILITYTSQVKNIFGDSYRIAQVLINLISNAIKYSNTSDKIIIESTDIKNDNTLFLKISVTDFGIGIDQKSQEKIFEKFYRVQEQGLETFPGFGLGLYISQKIITRHGGTLGVTSQKGNGSTFYFTLPLSQPIDVKS